LPNVFSEESAAERSRSPEQSTSKLRGRFPARLVFQDSSVLHSTPGPGAYRDVSPDFVRPSSKSASFSRSTRGDIWFNSDSLPPGPGAYTPAPPSRSHYVTSQGMSIPRAHRGIIDTIDRKELDYSRILPGPGDYTPRPPSSPGRTMRIPSAPRFQRGSNFRDPNNTAANPTIAPDKEITPGPGAYGPEKGSSLSHLSRKGGAMSKSKRPPIFDAELSEHPGPGAYNPDASASSLYFNPHHVAQQTYY